MLHQRSKDQRARAPVTAACLWTATLFAKWNGRERCLQSLFKSHARTSERQSLVSPLEVYLQIQKHTEKSTQEPRDHIHGADTSITFAVPNTDAKCDRSLISVLTRFSHVSLRSSLTTHPYDIGRAAAHFWWQTLEADSRFNGNPTDFIPQGSPGFKLRSSKL